MFQEMGVKTDLHMFKSWENPLSARLELNIFPTTEQKLQFQTVLKRNIQDEGTLYSGELQAKSDVNIIPRFETIITAQIIIVC